MPVDITVRGDLDQLRRISRHLREAADKDLKRYALRGLNEATKDSKQAVRDQAADFLPNRYAASLVPTLSFRTSRGQSRVRITTRAKGPKGPRYVGALNRGKLRHPLFGNRKHWFGQAVRPGFVTEPMRKLGPETYRKVNKVLGELAEKIAHG